MYETIKIYSLDDPITNEVKYIGQTKVSLEKRLKGHISDVFRPFNTHKINWIKKLLSQNLVPLISFIDEVEESQADYYENWYMNVFKAWGFSLTNSDKASLVYRGEKPNHSEITKNKISLFQRNPDGSTKTLEQKFGKEKADEIKLKIKNNSKVKDEVVRKKLSDAKKGKAPNNKGKICTPCSLERKEKIRNSNLGKTRGGQWVKQINLTTGEETIFKSLRLLNKFYNFNFRKKFGFSDKIFFKEYSLEKLKKP